MTVRISKLLAQRGVCSRREAARVVDEGRVRVNGQIIYNPGTLVDPDEDHVRLDDRPLPAPPPITWVMMNKPLAVITTDSDPQGRKTTADLLPERLPRVEPVGRLDYHTEGLLLLTNDGDLAHTLTHPRYHVPRTYMVKITGSLAERHLIRLRRGLRLEDGPTAPATVTVMSDRGANSWLRITVREGRNRLIRRMIDAVGQRILKLRRIAYGGLTLGTLRPGQVRPLTGQEMAHLRALARVTPEGQLGDDIGNAEAAPREPRGIGRVARMALGEEPWTDLPPLRLDGSDEEEPRRRGKGWALPAHRRPGAKPKVRPGYKKRAAQRRQGKSRKG